MFRPLFDNHFNRTARLVMKDVSFVFTTKATIFKYLLTQPNPE